MFGCRRSGGRKERTSGCVYFAGSQGQRSPVKKVNAHASTTAMALANLFGKPKEEKRYDGSVVQANLIWEERVKAEDATYPKLMPHLQPYTPYRNMGKSELVAMMRSQGEDRGGWKQVFDDPIAYAAMRAVRDRVTNLEKEKQGCDVATSNSTYNGPTHSLEWSHRVLNGKDGVPRPKHTPFRTSSLNPLSCDDMCSSTTWRGRSIRKGIPPSTSLWCAGWETAM